MIDIFDNKPLNLNNLTYHSGGTEGSDIIWETEGEKYVVKTKDYSYKTPKHKSKNKVEITEEDYKEGLKLEIERHFENINQVCLENKHVCDVIQVRIHIGEI